MSKCELCEVEHDDAYGSGRFCSRRCARAFATSKNRESINTRVGNKLRGKKRSVHHKNIDEIKSILELSSRTVSKILQRAGIGCVMCGWNKSSLDVHHIVHQAKGGSDDHENLITICPNCHRMAHRNLYTVEQLTKHNMSIVFTDWKRYYNTKGD